MNKPCPFSDADLQSGGSPADHARCLLRKVKVGGNVDDAVTMKHVPVTTDGMLAEPGQRVLDTRYPWFVVLRVMYDR